MKGGSRMEDLESPALAGYQKRIELSFQNQAYFRSQGKSHWSMIEVDVVGKGILLPVLITAATAVAAIHHVEPLWLVLGIPLALWAGWSAWRDLVCSYGGLWGSMLPHDYVLHVLIVATAVCVAGAGVWTVTFIEDVGVGTLVREQVVWLLDTLGDLGDVLRGLPAKRGAGRL
ncbi:MAG: hypothetical protein OXC13_15795 [Caldilineaceae bacterium]|nr:hypothetical protein [Caldilineaceae bacterium]